MTHFTTLLGAALLTGASLAALAVTLPAYAQSAPTLAAAEAAAEVADANVIIVQAQKRDEDAQDVPISITALGTQELAAAGVTDTEELRVAVPALNITRGAGGFALPRIRGVGATGQGNGIENPVAIYVDNVYYLATTGLLQSLFDAEQVAVLKGPQGTLFGRNATGGLIQIKTLDPSLGEARGKAQFGYGNYDTVSAAGFVSVPVSSTVAVSISGQYDNRQDGFGTNRFTGNDVQDERTYAMRGKILFKPGPDTRVVLSGDFNGTDAGSPAFVPFSRNTQGLVLPDLIEAQGGDREYDILADVDPDLRARQHGGSLNIEQSLGGMKLNSVTAYRKTSLDLAFDPDGTTVATLRIFNNNIDKTFSQEIDLISDNDGPLSWAIGAFYLHNKAGQFPGRTTGLTIFGGNGFSDDFNQVELDSYSGFAEGTYAIGGNTNVTAGVRYTSDTRTLNQRAVTFNGNTGITTTSSIAEQERTFKKVSYKISADHRFSPELLAYASYNRGFRAGTFVPQGNPITILDPEVVDAYEVGFKSDLFDRRVRLNLSGYYYDQSSVQVIQVIAGVQNVYSARGGAEIYGADADFSVEITDNWKVFGGVAYNHARYKAFTDAIISIPFPLSTSLGAAGAAAFSTANFRYVDSQTGQTIANPVCLGTFLPPNIVTQAARDGFYRGRLGGNCLIRGDATGNRLQNTPDWTFSLGSSLDVPTSIGKFTLGGNLYYNDGYVGTPDERVTQKSFTQVNASLTWRDRDEHLFVRLWGNNLTDAFYRTQIGASNSADNGTSGAPQTYGVTLGFDF